MINKPMRATFIVRYTGIRESLSLRRGAFGTRTVVTVRPVRPGTPSSMAPSTVACNKARVCSLSCPCKTTSSRSHAPSCDTTRPLLMRSFCMDCSNSASELAKTIVAPLASSSPTTTERSGAGNSKYTCRVSVRLKLSGTTNNITATKTTAMIISM